MSFDYGNGSNFTNKDRKSRKGVYGYGGNSANTTSADSFSAEQRVRLQLDAVASESLSGTVFFEIGEQVWGQASDSKGNAKGGALGADGTIVEVKRAYIDWIVPNTDLKVRMGLQGLGLPSFTAGSMVFDDDVAGIVLSNKFNDNVTLTAFWARPFNDNYNYVAGTKNDNPTSYMDNMDMFGLLLPLSFDGVKVTPWAAIAAIGPNVVNPTYGYGSAPAMGNAWSRVKDGMLPGVVSAKNTDRKLNQYGTAFWAGLTGEVTMWDPFRLAWDVNYGGVDYGREYLNRSGWYASLLAEYKLDWATPGIYGWYSSGDDNNIKNGSERMAVLDANGNNQFSNFAFNGNPYLAREGLIQNHLIGTWGIGARLKDMSFLENLKHTFRVNYINGTNSPTMAKYILGKKETTDGRTIIRQYDDFNDLNANGLYLTTEDKALEFGLSTEYKIYENLTMFVDAAYIAMWLDNSRSVWGNNSAYNVRGASTTDAFNVNASFIYSF